MNPILNRIWCIPDYFCSVLSRCAKIPMRSKVLARIKKLLGANPWPNNSILGGVMLNLPMTLINSESRPSAPADRDRVFIVFLLSWKFFYKLRSPTPPERVSNGELLFNRFRPLQQEPRQQAKIT